MGDEIFVERSQAKAKVEGDELSIPQAQRQPPAPSLEVIAGQQGERDVAITAAYATGAYSYRKIAEYFGLHLATVGRASRKQMLQGEN